MQDGSREGRFSNAHGSCRVTAISFDKNERRLVTAANDASIHMWNFNNGSLLRRWSPKAGACVCFWLNLGRCFGAACLEGELSRVGPFPPPFCWPIRPTPNQNAPAPLPSFQHDQEKLEVCCVLFARDEKRGSDSVYAAGWNKKVARALGRAREQAHLGRLGASGCAVQTAESLLLAVCCLGLPFQPRLARPTPACRRLEAQKPPARPVAPSTAAQVFVWQDEGEGDVTQYRTYEGHATDVLAMAASHQRGLLATGEARGSSLRARGRGVPAVGRRKAEGPAARRPSARRPSVRRPSAHRPSSPLQL